MQYGKPSSPNSSTVESLLEMIISEINNESIVLNDVDRIFTKVNLEYIFKNIKQDFDDLLPNLIGISTLLCLVMYRLFSVINDDLPNLSSEFNLDRLLSKVDTKEIGLHPPHWDQVSNIALVICNLLGENKTRIIRQKTEDLDFDELFTDDALGTAIQNNLPSHLRKALAANYTSLNSSRLLSLIAMNTEFKTIIDPFCGSGRLLTAYLSECKNKQLAVHGNEILGIAAFLTFVRLAYWYASQKLKLILDITSDDAFSRFSLSSQVDEPEHHLHSYNLVLMNPPFTRYLRIQRAYLKDLKNLFTSYVDYMQPQMGLHVFAIFLADMLLEENGRIAAVLPAPTFYSEYSKGLMKFLTRNYQIRYIVGTTTGKAFSEGSDLREILFVADKKKPTASSETTFISIDRQLTQENVARIAESIRANTSCDIPIKLQKIAQRELDTDWNWTRYLETGILQDIAKEFRGTNLIKSSRELDLRIIRGFEMYGPNFFFLPNTYWKIRQEEKESIIIENEASIKLSVEKSLLSKALRRPGLYSTQITPLVNHFVLNVPNTKLSEAMNSYVSSNPKSWQVAEKRFGPDWITHIHQQFQSKKPFGHLFIVDKFGITSTGVIAHFTDERISASKNFYIIDCSSKTAKILGAWLNSTLFIVLYLTSRREIGGAYGRLQIVDYQKEPLFIDIHKIDGKTSREIEGVFDILRKQPLAPLNKQLNLKTRRELDALFLQVLGYSKDVIDELLNSIYDQVSLVFDNLDTRSKHKRERM